MARTRFQNGWLHRGKREWFARWREDQTQPDGSIKRVVVSHLLGDFKALPTEKLAERERAKLLLRERVNDPDKRPGVIKTFRELVKEYEETVLIAQAESSQDKEKSRLKVHILPAFGDLFLNDIDSQRVQKFVSGLKCGDKTKLNIVNTLRCVWNCGLDWEWTDRDPFRRVKLPKWNRPEAKYFTLDECRRIIQAAQEPYRTYYWLMAETGIRAGEAAALRKCDISFNGDRAALVIRRSSYRGRVKSDKSGRPRAIPLSPQLAAHLKARLESLGAENLLFPSESPNVPWPHDSVRKHRFYPLLDALGIERKGFHAYRHGSATVLDSINAPEKVRTDRLGHTSFALTLGVYTHSQSQDHMAVAEQLGSLLQPQELVERRA